MEIVASYLNYRPNASDGAKAISYQQLIRMSLTQAATFMWERTARLTLDFYKKVMLR